MQLLATPQFRASLNSHEMGLVHDAQHGVVLPHCAAFCGMLRRSQGKQTENCGAVCRSCSVFWQQRRGEGEAVAGLSCVDCQLTCHMLEILNGTRTGHSTEAAAAILGKLSFWPPAKCGFICIAEI